MTTKAAAEAIESSESKLNRVESGHNQLPRVRDLEDLLVVYGVTDPADREHLLSLHRDSLSSDWYRPYKGFMPSGQLLYVGLESEASAMRAWHSQVVFGLLQTENYARAMFMTAKMVDERTTEFIESNVALRMARKRVIHGDDPVELRVILDEGALRRVIGGPDIMREQYEEIEKLASLDHVSVQILPQALSTYRAPENFVMLDFDAGFEPVVMEDGSSVLAVTDKPREVWKYTRKFDAMREGALAPAKTADVLHRLAREIDDY